MSRARFAVVIATCNRPRLLAQRALPSIANQTRRPALVVVADDSAPQFRKRNAKTLAAFSARTGIRTCYIENHRSRGASGCWNSGVLTVLDAARNADDADEVYLAILDDDDEWLDCHLANARCAVRGVGKDAADFLIAAHQRNHSGKQSVIRAPQKLVGGEWLTGNPGVVGSSLIVRLSTFLQAGMFDEALPSCTDRDLCFRLSLLPGINYRPLNTVSVVHHADTNRVRLSIHGSATKINGLSYFADKYRGWMRADVYAAFCLRAKRLFGWRESHLHQLLTSTRTVRKRKPTPAPSHKSVTVQDALSLIIGVTVGARAAQLPLFDDIAKLAKDKRVIGTDVVVLPRADSDAASVEKAALMWRRCGLTVHCVPTTHAANIMRALSLSPTPADQPRAIAVNRTILQHAMFAVGRRCRTPAFWVLDDDLRLHGLQHELRSGANKPTVTAVDYIGEMLRLRAAGCDVAVGAIHGAPPLPRALSVRTQMVDLLHYFARLHFAPSQRNFPALSLANTPHMIAGDYYHDCADQPHLEQPIGVNPLPKNCSRARFIRALPKLLTRVLAGDAVTRPLLGGVADSQTQRHRSGNTLMFNAEVLCACPNGFMHEKFSGMRRQDEVWRVFGESAFGWRVACGNFPVTQHRANAPPQAPDTARIHADIVGHAISSALRDVVAGQRFDDLLSLVKFLSRNRRRIVTEAEQLARMRVTMLRASTARIIGVARCMRAMLREQDAGSKQAAAALRGLEKRFAWEPPARALKSAFNTADIGAAIADFPLRCRQLSQFDATPAWLADERQKNAHALLMRRFKFKAESKTKLRLLGRGDEGTVYTDNRNVYKVLYRWYSYVGIPHPQSLNALQKLVNINSDIVYPIKDYWRSDGDLVLVTPFEKTVPYEGGHGAGVVAMLSALKSYGIAPANIAPKNLRRVKNRVRLIDYGQQIALLTDKRFDLTVRKAWLSWRYASHEKLPALLTASLTNAKLPELNDYRQMKRAAEQFATRYRVADGAFDTVLAAKPRRVLDYGCRRGADALRLARARIQVAAFDPNMEARARRTLINNKVRVLTKAQVFAPAPHERYDAILLRHVICEIAGDQTLAACLRNIHRLLAPRGIAVVTVCDMDRIVREKLYAVNLMPRNADCRKKFFYRKQLRLNNAIRRHVHRPQARLETLFTEAGFAIHAITRFPDMDLEQFTPCGGVLQWVLRVRAPPSCR